MKNKLPYCNIRFVFQTKCKISNFFTFKDKIPSFLRSDVVYRFQCDSCNATCYGKAKQLTPSKIKSLPFIDVFIPSLTQFDT